MSLAFVFLNTDANGCAETLKPLDIACTSFIDRFLSNLSKK